MNSSAATNGPTNTVFVVDDDPIICDVISGMLEVFGHRVITHSDSEEALAALEPAAIDLLIVDLTMPKLSGIELMELLRIRGVGVPVILTSGFPQTAEISRACESDRVCFLKKPFTMDDLSVAVTRMLPTKE